MFPIYSSVESRHQARRPSLSPQIQLCDDLPVAIRVRTTQVSQVPPPLAYQLEQAASRGLVVLVELQVLSEHQDALGQKRYLHFWRSCVLRMDMVFLNDTLFVILLQGCATPPSWSRP